MRVFVRKSHIQKCLEQISLKVQFEYGDECSKAGIKSVFC